MIVALWGSRPWLRHLQASPLLFHSFQYFSATFLFGFNPSTRKKRQHRWFHGSFLAKIKKESRNIKLRDANSLKVLIVSANKNSSILVCFKKAWRWNNQKEKCRSTFGLKQQVNPFVGNKFQMRLECYWRTKRKKYHFHLRKKFAWGFWTTSLVLRP